MVVVSSYPCSTKASKAAPRMRLRMAFRSSLTALSLDMVPMGTIDQPPLVPKGTREAEVAEAVVRLANVEKVYAEDGLRVPAVRDVSFDVQPRKFSMIVGPSGSGKTTLLNLIGCIDVPSAGSVEVCGQPIAELSDDALADFRSRNIGFVFQNFNLLPVLTAFENVEYPLLLLEEPAARRRERVMEVLEAVGLAD